MSPSLSASRRIQHQDIAVLPVAGRGPGCQATVAHYRQSVPPINFQRNVRFDFNTVPVYVNIGIWRVAVGGQICAPGPRPQNVKAIVPGLELEIITIVVHTLSICWLFYQTCKSHAKVMPVVSTSDPPVIIAYFFAVVKALLTVNPLPINPAFAVKKIVFKGSL